MQRRGKKKANASTSKVSLDNKAPAPPGFEKQESLGLELNRGLRGLYLHCMLDICVRGDRVQATTIAGTVYSGVLFCVPIHAGSEAHFGMKLATLESGKPHASFVAGGLLRLHVNEISELSLITVLGSRNKSAEMLTDTEITGTASNELYGRQLQSANAWLEPAASNVSGDLTEDVGKWDQFSVNEKKFGVKNTFDENLYTTKLDKSKMSLEQIRKADKLALEIEKQVSTNYHLNEERGKKSNTDLDEEARYSSVNTSERAYVPPAFRESKRKSLSTKQPNSKPVSPAAPMSYCAAASQSSKNAIHTPDTLSTKERPSKGQSPIQQGHSKSASPKKNGSTKGASPRKQNSFKASPTKQKSSKTISPTAPNHHKKDSSSQNSPKTVPSLVEATTPTNANTSKKSPKKSNKAAETKQPKLNPKAKEFVFSPGAASFVPAAPSYPAYSTPYDQHPPPYAGPYDPTQFNPHYAPPYGYAPPMMYNPNGGYPGQNYEQADYQSGHYAYPPGGPPEYPPLPSEYET